MGTLKKNKPHGVERTRRVLSERNANQNNPQGYEVDGSANRTPKVAEQPKTVRRATKRGANKAGAKHLHEPADENDPKQVKVAERPTTSKPKRVPLSVKNTTEKNAEKTKTSTEHLVETPRSSLESKFVNRVRILEGMMNATTTEQQNGPCNVIRTVSKPDSERPVCSKTRSSDDKTEISLSPDPKPPDPVFKMPRSSPRQLAKTAVVEKGKSKKTATKLLEKTTPDTRSSTRQLAKAAVENKKSKKTPSKPTEVASPETRSSPRQLAKGNSRKRVAKPLEDATPDTELASAPSRTRRKHTQQFEKAEAEQEKNSDEHVFKKPDSFSPPKTVQRAKNTGAGKKSASKRTVKNTKIAVSETPRRGENRLKHPVYKTVELTLKQQDPRSTEDKLHEYDFEFDSKEEEEPVPKKKRKPIMKIQRVRTYARKKKIIPGEAPSIPLLIQEMLLSTPIRDEKEKKKKIDKEKVHPHRLLDVEPVTDNRNISTLSTAKTPAREPEGSPEKQPNNFENMEPPPSPCPSFDDNDCPPSRPSSPVEDMRDSFTTVPIPTLHFDRFTNSSTPNYNANATPRYSCNSSRKSNLLADASMTPIKYHCEASYFSLCDLDEPRKFDVGNCFGFDEWDVDDPEKITTSYPPPQPRPKPANLPKPPPMPAAEVIKLIEGSQTQVEEDASMYDTSSETMLENTSSEFTSRSDVTDATSFVSEVTASDTIVDSLQLESLAPLDSSHLVPRKPKKSFERPRRFQKHVSFEEEEEENDSLSEEDDPGGYGPKDPKKKINKKPKKKENGMNKKEEEEFEKWAAAFNAQCREIEKYELCVE